jgi:opacity protein-like surface antigen
MDGRDLLRFVDIDPNLEGNNEQIITRLNTEQYDLPLAFRIGLAWDVIKTPASRITVATDALSPNDYTEYVNAGLEYAFREMVFLRGGYKGLGVPGDEVGYALGGGVNYDFDSTIRLRIDYAYSDFGRLDNTQRISMGILF